MLAPPSIYACSDVKPPWSNPHVQHYHAHSPTSCLPMHGKTHRALRPPGAAHAPRRPPTATGRGKTHSLPPPGAMARTHTLANGYTERRCSHAHRCYASTGSATATLPEAQAGASVQASVQVTLTRLSSPNLPEQVHDSRAGPKSSRAHPTGGAQKRGLRSVMPGSREPSGPIRPHGEIRHARLRCFFFICSQACI